MVRIKNRFTGELILELETLQRANLRGADLHDADLRGADLQDADLWYATSRGAKLLGANLQRANLLGADLRGADLRKTDLLGADLRKADLRGADVRGANLRGAAIVVRGLRWDIYITNGHIRIGCQAHELYEWENFADDAISHMAVGALEFWTANKTWILATCRSITKGD